MSAPFSSCYNSESELSDSQGKLYTVARNIEYFGFQNRDNEYRTIFFIFVSFSFKKSG